MSAALEIVLDVRGLSDPPSCAADFGALWSLLAPTLTGRMLSPGRTHAIDHPGRGSVLLTVLAAPETPLSLETPVAIHSIIEPDPRLPRCRKCGAEGRLTQGPYACAGCSAQSLDPFLCEDHVVVPDGSLRPFCLEHAPRCSCGGLATFWCGEPRCRFASAFCRDHAIEHPSDPELSYCRDCYQLLYPECEAAGCVSTGIIMCELVDRETEQVCGRRGCARHGRRWQVFGPHKEGLGLCRHHALVGSFPEREIVLMLTAGCAGRALRTRVRQPLPSLQSVHHILLNAKQRSFPLTEIGSWFEDLTQELDTSSPLRRRMKESLQDHKRYRESNLERDRSEKTQGLEKLEELRRCLRKLGKAELADAIVFCDYRPKAATIFISLPPHLKGLFIGTKGAHVKKLETMTGMKIRFERGS